MTDKRDTEKKYRIFTSASKAMYDDVHDKSKHPAHLQHMKPSGLMEYYYWKGVEFEKLQNNNRLTT